MLLGALHAYYRQRESAYLALNAQLIGTSLAEAMAAGESIEIVAEKAGDFARLTQTRVRLWSTDGQLLVDVSGVQPLPAYLTLASEFPSPPRPPRLPRAPRAPGLPDLPALFAGAAEPVPATVLPATPESVTPLAATPIPLASPIDEMQDGVRDSARRVSLPIYGGEENTFWGHVELVGGPDYGRTIIRGVAAAWLLAGAVAVALAAFAGWLVSRRLSAPLLTLTKVTTRMSEGDLSARADIVRQDEFGLLARSFNEMAGQVEATVATLSRFVGDAAHELNTPLTALRNSLDLALEEQDVAGQLALIKHGRSQVTRLEELTRGLLDLSRLEAGKTHDGPATVDLVALLLKTSESYASRAEQAGLSFVLDLPDGPLFVQGDETRLRRAVANLIDNAVKFTIEGGTVTLSLSGDDWVTVSVTDSGIGIPAQDLPFLFQRFHRGSNTAAYAGSGLGLAIVKAIVEGHGGSVAAENVDGGARFWVRLPRARL